MLSTAGGAGSWARSAAGSPRRSKPAVRNWRKRRIGKGRRVGGPDPGGSGTGLRLGAGQRAERKPLAIGRHIDFDLVSSSEVSQQYLLAERILDVALDRALQRAGAVVLIVAVLDQELDRGRRELDLVAQAALNLLEQDRHDLRDVVLGQRVEDDD